jgi:hypothetical protein
MKFIVFFAVAGVAILFVDRTEVFSRATGAEKAEKNILQVNDILERAAAGGPVQGQPPDQAWVRRMNAECARRERRLTALARPTSLDGIGAYAGRIHAIHVDYARRAARLKPPAADADDARQVRQLNAEQERALRRIARIARTRNYSAASTEALALRELAGRMNTVLLGLGLNQCALRASAMPL